ncbi:MAG TPA: AAA family ATPase [Candidatus Deferrimicrobium sp.]|nr:AAA family ATPase [Candidatus Deferrimicrobium sp.]
MQYNEDSDINGCYFLSLKVENIACFGNPQTLDLSCDGKPARWTVIIGDNGAGKTTLLRCLAGISPYSIDNPDTMTFQTTDLNWKFKKKEGLQSGVEAIFAVNWKFTAKKREFPTAHRKYIERIITQIAPPDFSSTIEFPETAVVSDLYFKKFKFICYGYGAARRMSSSKILTEKGEFAARSLFDDNASLINAEEWLLQLDYISTKDRKYLKYRKQVEDIIINLLPDVTKIDYRIEKNISKVIFETPSGWVGIDQLGLGYRTMLTWMVDFAARLFERYPDSKNPLAEPAILLLDEIDLHLHPKWQRTIIDYLTGKFPNTQFIVTAHSPLLVQSAEGANLVLLRRQGSESIIDNDPVSVKNWRVDQILTSDLFGVESTRSKETQQLFNERTRLLSKGTLSQKDMENLAELERQMADVPFGDTKEEIEADFLIKKIAAKIRKPNTGKESPDD